MLSFMHTPTKKILVVGSTGGSGRAAVERLLAEGHEVTAFSRHADRMDLRSDRLRFINADAMNPADLDAAVPGHDAVIVTLGISENPLRVRLLGPARTPKDVRSTGTRNVIAAMRKHGVRRLVVQTTYGVGETRDRLRPMDALFFALLLHPQIVDTAKQNQLVHESGLDWVIVQPVHLTDDAEDVMPFVSITGDTKKMKVSRNSVARFLTRAATTSNFVHREVAISGAQAAA
jgi:uncharacterized protein YbjT (DUF2867 family)